MGAAEAPRRLAQTSDTVEAEAALAVLAGQLEKVSPDATGSPREGLAGTPPLTRPAVTGPLLKKVRSTNRIEPIIEIVRERART